jgi:hypothetical protein
MQTYSADGYAILTPRQLTTIGRALESTIRASRSAPDLTSAEAAAIASALLDLADELPAVAERKAVVDYYALVVGAQQVKLGRSGTWHQLAAGARGSIRARIERAKKRRVR